MFSTAVEALNLARSVLFPSQVPKLQAQCYKTRFRVYGSGEVDIDATQAFPTIIPNGVPTTIPEGFHTRGTP